VRAARRRVGLGLALGLAAWLTPTAGEAATRPCPPRGADVVARGDLTLAFETGGDVYACNRRTGRRWWIGSGETLGAGTEVASVVRVSGRYVAWAEYDGSLGYPNHRVFRQNVVTGAFKAWPSGDRECPRYCGEGIGPTRQLVVNPRGSLAWVAWDGQTAEVWRVDGRGLVRLARGTEVDSTFIRRRNGLIEWREGGVVRRDTLDP
jgi:hypothetical protein